MIDPKEPTASEGLSAALTPELPAEVVTNAPPVANNLDSDKPDTTQTPKTVANNAAINALLTSNIETAPIAAEQLAGVSNANLANATLSSVRPVSASMLSTLREMSNDASLQDRSATGHDTNGRVWVQALGNSATLDDKQDDSALRQRTHGVVVGADWSLDNEWRAGVLGGKSQTRLDGVLLDGDLDSWHLGAYALRQSGPLVLRLGATYSSHDGTTKRNIAFNGYSDPLKGSYDASSQQVFAEVGYNLSSGALQAEPFASLGYEHYQRDSYREKGGDAALKVDKQTQRNFNSIFGLRLAHRSDLENGMSLTPRMSTGWKHTYGDVSSHIHQTFLVGGESFYVGGIPLDRNSLTLEAGLDLRVTKQHSLSVAYNGEISSNSHENGVMGQWRMNF
ncbi:autotransporter domain-containing protein [Pseudomonas sp. CVAP|uniref:autotransporter outer membrane beta-barrel domain-containing protein n=1 Tax=Pseudomonas sp. CVAP\|nr:autotransporter outer membrane beta-barrel domain-containing protein [Pseudomonas sp. CVAP\